MSLEGEGLDCMKQGWARLYEFGRGGAGLHEAGSLERGGLGYMNLEG